MERHQRECFLNKKDKLLIEQYSKRHIIYEAYFIMVLKINLNSNLISKHVHVMHSLPGILGQYDPVCVQLTKRWAKLKQNWVVSVFLFSVLKSALAPDVSFSFHLFACLLLVSIMFRTRPWCKKKAFWADFFILYRVSQTNKTCETAAEWKNIWFWGKNWLCMDSLLTQLSYDTKKSENKSWLGEHCSLKNKQLMDWIL